MSGLAKSNIELVKRKTFEIHLNGSSATVTVAGRYLCTHHGYHFFLHLTHFTERQRYKNKWAISEVSTGHAVCFSSTKQKAIDKFLDKIEQLPEQALTAHVKKVKRLLKKTPWEAK